MRLFASERVENLLPYDGLVTYYGIVLDAPASDLHFERLFKTIDWRPDELVIAGRRIVTKRKIAWFGDAAFSYIYSGTTKEAKEWTEELLELREIVERITSAKYNSCLLNLYHNGEEGLSWHSDNEDTLVRNGTIASLSLGAERKFVFKHRKTKERVPIPLEHGSLLAMKGETQKHWAHSLPKSVKVTRPRISLTFRMMQE
ncbi:MAG: alpha-ketoglutarate-dependent dioxygenase AlkB [Acidobacteriota bacterium]